MVFGKLNISPAGSMIRKSRDKRKSSRRQIGTSAWFRPDGGFALRPCRVIDVSGTGVCISVDAPGTVPATFHLVMSRNGGLGQLAYVKWRRGTKIGAVFV